MKNEATVDAWMNRLAGIYSRALFGCTDELNALFVNNRDAFQQHRYYTDNT